MPKLIQNKLLKPKLGRPKKQRIKDEINEEQTDTYNFTSIKIEFKKHLVEL